jgi:hypothetical protein
MKTRLGVLLIIWGLMVSCSGKEKYVDTTVAVIDSIYSRNKDFLTNLSIEIDSIDEIRNAEKLVVMEVSDSSQIESSALINKIAANDAFLNPEFKFSNKNTCIVTKTANLRDFFGVPSDSIVAARKYSFDLNFVADDFFNTFDNDRLWDYHQDKGASKTFPDSIYPGQKRETIATVSKYLKNLQGIKYLVVLTDLYYMKPKMATAKEFESGLLLTAVDVYSRKDKKKLGHKILFITNSDEIGALPIPMDDEEFKKRVYYRSVEANLAQNRNKETHNFLNRKETPAH